MRRALPVLVLLLVATVAVPGQTLAVGVNSLGLRAKYTVDASFAWSSRAVSVQSTANVKNTTSSSTNELAFNLSTLRTGHAHLGSVLVDGHGANATVNDQTVLVPLGRALAPGERVVVAISYTATLSSSTSGDRFGFARTGGVMTAYRWIPWLSRPTQFNRPSVGETWVTPTSPSVRVTLTSDRKLTFATSGRRVAGNGLSQTFVAKKVRDFNFSAAPDYRKASRTVGRKRITFYYRKMSPGAVLKTAARALRSYSANIGAYPYANVNIAEIMRGGASIESPSLFWINPDEPRRLLSWDVAHEMAHQWFYSVVGNHQAQQPFADEAVADFIARDLVDHWAKPKCGTQRLDQSVYDLGSCYPWVIYVQGNLYLRAYRDKVGNAAFYRGLRNYYRHYKFGIGGTRQLLDALDNAAGISYPHYKRFPSLY